MASSGVGWRSLVVFLFPCLIPCLRQFARAKGENRRGETANYVVVSPGGILADAAGRSGIRATRDEREGRNFDKGDLSCRTMVLSVP